MNAPATNVAKHDDRSAEQRLAAFGLAVLEQHRDGCGDVDGAALQDLAERAGLLCRVQVAEPCGEACACVEYDDFPQGCLRLAEDVRSLAEARGEAPGG